jgi:hypothetical protein
MSPEKKRFPHCQESTIFGYPVIGYLTDGPIESPDGMVPYRSSPGHLLAMVEVEGFRPGAGTQVLGKIPSGEWVIKACDKGDVVFLAAPSKCKPSFRKDKDLSWVKFDEEIK